MKIFTKEFYKEEDKQMHIIFSVFVVLIASYVMMFMGVKKECALLIAFVVTITIGWLKELTDEKGLGTKDVYDIDADMVGIIIGTLFTYMLDTYVTKFNT